MAKKIIGKHRNKCFTTFWPVFSLLIQQSLAFHPIYSDSLDISQENNRLSKEDNITKEYLQIDSLPDTFSDDKLPIKDEGATQCYKHIGCVSKIPHLSFQPYDPFHIKAEFSLATREKETKIPYQQVLHCILDTNDCQLYPYSLRLLKESGFRPERKTIIVTAGFMTLAPCSWQLEIKRKWLNLSDSNVILTSWNKGSHGFYGEAAANTKIISRQITVLLYYLAVLNNLQLDDTAFTENIYLVGHSLGAHISGFVGQDLAGGVGRITGLDPAGPEFNDLERKFKLDRTDAILVDAIHTNGGANTLTQHCFGTKYQVGHLDFMANNGISQPGCSHDIFGCSHKIAPMFYVAFLDHQIHILNFLNHRYHNCHRLFAYASPTYEEFQDGSSLSIRCPLTTLDDKDLISADIRNCTIPVDFTESPGVLRKELEQNYNVSFDPDSYQNTRYFFYTRDSYPYVNNHNLIKVRISKEMNLGSAKEFSEKCDIVLDLINAAGVTTLQHTVKNYKLIDQKDHFEVAFPYLPSDYTSVYDIALLDSNDFFLNGTGDRSKLLELITKFYPASLRINGLGVVKPVQMVKKISTSLVNAFRGLFRMNKKTDKDEEQAKADKLRHQCTVKIESVLIQPLKKLHRHFSAAYTAEAATKDTPDIIVLDQRVKAPQIDVNKSKEPGVSTTTNVSEDPIDEATKADIASRSINEIFIDTVIIGPHDDSIDYVYDDDDLQFDDDSIPNAENSQIRIDSSSIPAKIWLILTLSLALVIIICAFLYTKYTGSTSTKEDTDELIEEPETDYRLATIT